MGSIKNASDLLHQQIQPCTQRSATGGDLLERGALRSGGGDLATDARQRELKALDLEVSAGRRGHRRGANRELADERDDLTVVELVQPLRR